MAVDFSTNNYFLKDLIPISTFPITISFWLKADSIPASGKWCHLVSRTKTDIRIMALYLYIRLLRLEILVWDMEMELTIAIRYLLL